MRRLIIISSSGLTLLFLVVLAWSVWTVVRAPFVMQTAGLPWAHERQQDEERKAKAAAEARRLPEERMRLAASDKAADEAEARRKVEEQQELAPPAVSPPSQGSPIGARGRNTDGPGRTASTFPGVHTWPAPTTFIAVHVIAITLGGAVMAVLGWLLSYGRRRVTENRNQTRNDVKALF